MVEDVDLQQSEGIWPPRAALWQIKALVPRDILKDLSS